MTEFLRRGAPGMQVSTLNVRSTVQDIQYAIDGRAAARESLFPN